MKSKTINSVNSFPHRNLINPKQMFVVFPETHKHTHTDTHSHKVLFIQKEKISS